MGNFSRGATSSLPGNDADLSTIYSPAEVLAVANEDDTLVEQDGELQYMIHQFKVDVGSALSAGIEFAGESSLPTTSSTVYLQIYNQNSHQWDTLASNNTYPFDVTFELSAPKVDLTNYKSGTVISCRVYQLAI